MTDSVEARAISLALELSQVTHHTMQRWQPVVHRALAVGMDRFSIMGCPSPTMLEIAVGLAERRSS